MASQKPSTPKGFRDFLPREMARREYVFNTLKDVFRTYGYENLETPSMELLETLTGKYGEEGDRLIFRVLNSGEYLGKARKSQFDFAQEKAERKLTPLISEKAMRYDLTVPFARLVVEHQHELVFPFRRFQIQPVWRADNTQAGRYREFYQCDCDVIGSESLILDAELVCIYDEAFRRLRVPVKILISNRKILSGMADVAGAPDKVPSICIAIDKLDKIGAEKVKEELASRGISAQGIESIFSILGIQGTNEEKLAQLEVLFAGSPTGLKGIEEMREVFSILKNFHPAHAEVEFDLSLARGIDYYTGTIYEVKAAGATVGSIGGGGRYDNLTGVFGLSGMSGVGISFGADRICIVMEELGLFGEIKNATTRVIFINFGGESAAVSLRLLAQLRAAGVPSEIYPSADKVGKQYKYADKRGILYAVAIGETELASGNCLLKNMTSGEQITLPIQELVSHLTSQAK